MTKYLEETDLLHDENKLANKIRQTEKKLLIKEKKTMKTIQIEMMQLRIAQNKVYTKIKYVLDSLSQHSSLFKSNMFFQSFFSNVSGILFI